MAELVEGVKNDKDKPRMDLLDSDFLEGIAQVLTFGANKYEAHNWRKGISYSRVVAAAMRHISAFMMKKASFPIYTMQLVVYNFSHGIKLIGQSMTTATSTNKYHQTRVESFVEAWINIFIGFWINFTANLIILPAFGFTTLTVAVNFIIGMIYTVISVARSYVIRRWAQEHLKKLVKAIATFIRKFRK